ncbi:hypothetical protein Tco_0621366, partial [Tanacetum coccineum]
LYIERSGEEEGNRFRGVQGEREGKKLVSGKGKGKN